MRGALFLRTATANISKTQRNTNPNSGDIKDHSRQTAAYISRWLLANTLLILLQYYTTIGHLYENTEVEVLY